MSEFTSYPREDYFETTLSADIDASVNTIGLNTAPSFALASGKVYAVIDYDKPSTKFEVISFTGISGTNLTGVTRGVVKYEGGASTAQTHASGAKVIITDNWQTWKDISTAIASKLDLAGGTITGNIIMTGDINLTGDIAQTGNVDVDGALTLTTPLAVLQGGTDSTNAADARTALSAAESGANSDITSLSALSTPLSVAQGGTGAATHTAKSVLVGNGTSAFTELAPGTASQVIISDGVDWTVDDPPIVGTAKALLSNINTTDGNNDAVARGSLVYGNSTPKWGALPIGASGTILSSDGIDVSWANPTLVNNYYVMGPVVTAPSSFIYYLNKAIDKCLFRSTTTENYLNMYDSKFISSKATAIAGTGNYLWNPYDYSGTGYILGYFATGPVWYRYDDDGTNETILTSTSATSPTTVNYASVYDFNDNIFFWMDATNSTTVRRYTVTDTEVADDSTATLTLSAAPVSAQGMFVTSAYLYILDSNSGYFIKKYDKTTGTLIWTRDLAGTTAIRFLGDSRNNALFSSPYGDNGYFTGQLTKLDFIE